MPTDAEVKAGAKEMLAEISTLSLATCSENAPWAATVFFTSDSDFNIYFVSDHRTQHGRDIAENARVAATVNPDCKTWDAIKGLQIRGEISVVDGLERAKAVTLYVKKFPHVGQLVQAPEGADEETIAQRLAAANIYKIAPEMIRVIDNSKGFGHKEEFKP